MLDLHACVNFKVRTQTSSWRIFKHVSQKLCNFDNVMWSNTMLPLRDTWERYLSEILEWYAKPSQDFWKRNLKSKKSIKILDHWTGTWELLEGEKESKHRYLRLILEKKLSHSKITKLNAASNTHFFCRQWIHNQCALIHRCENSRHRDHLQLF